MRVHVVIRMAIRIKSPVSSCRSRSNSFRATVAATLAAFGVVFPFHAPSLQQTVLDRPPVATGPVPPHGAPVHPGQRAISFSLFRP
jgi:hypothetical protein